MGSESTHLRALREARGLSLETVSDKAGINLAHLSRIERGLAVPSVNLLLKLMDLYRLDEQARSIRTLVPSRKVAAV